MVTPAGTATSGSSAATSVSSDRRPRSTSSMTSAAVNVFVMLAMASGESPSSGVIPSMAAPLAPVQALRPSTATPTVSPIRPSSSRARSTAAWSRAPLATGSSVSRTGPAGPVCHAAGGQWGNGGRTSVGRGGRSPPFGVSRAACGVGLTAPASTAGSGVSGAERKMLRTRAATRATPQPPATRMARDIGWGGWYPTHPRLTIVHFRCVPSFVSIANQCRCGRTCASSRPRTRIPTPHPLPPLPR
jgi:hypothetical protein